MICKSDVLACNRFNMLRLIAIYVVETRFAHGTCYEIDKLLKMQTPKSFGESVFVIDVLVFVIDVGIRNNYCLLVQHTDSFHFRFYSNVVVLFLRGWSIYASQDERSL